MDVRSWTLFNDTIIYIRKNDTTIFLYNLKEKKLIRSISSLPPLSKIFCLSNGWLVGEDEQDSSSKSSSLQIWNLESEKCEIKIPFPNHYPECTEFF